MTDFSGRGPTPDGRKKPDLVAVGVTEAANAVWESPGESLWRRVSGTSYSTPQVAGGAALLMGAGITDPIAIRALLIDSARPGRATPASAMGTQTGWQPDWGWGELDLDQAYAERGNLRSAPASAGRPGSSGPPRSPATAPRSAWNRRATTFLGDAIPRNWNTSTSALTNLDLVERDASTCAVRTSSTSAVDNVEQIRSPNAGDVLYVVRPQESPVDGRADEPFVLASTKPTTEVVSPAPVVSAELTPAIVRGGDIATLSVTVRNPSPDLVAHGLEVTPALSPNLELMDGAATQTSEALETATEQQFMWRLRATGDGEATARVQARATSCGEQLRGEELTSTVVDSSGVRVRGDAPSETVTSRGHDVATSPPVPRATPPTIPALLQITSIRQLEHPQRVAVTGTLAQTARGPVRVSLVLRRGMRRTALAGTIRAKAGRWRVVLRVPRRMRYSRAEVTARYGADGVFSAGTARRVLRVRSR